MRVIIAGGRNFDDYEKVRTTLNDIINDKKMIITEILSGHAKGADSLGEHYAETNDIKLAMYPADWDLHGKSAGHIRNDAMSKDADMLIAFWDGKSKGTANMINRALKRELFVKIVRYKE